MSASPHSVLAPFAADVLEGLSVADKSIPARYLYDQTGRELFHLITSLPEYGSARAEERLLRRHAPEIAAIAPKSGMVVDLAGIAGPASSQPLSSQFKPESLCESAARPAIHLGHDPAAWLAAAARVLAHRTAAQPVLVTLLGNSVGNLGRVPLQSLLEGLRALLRPGDSFLFAADLVKDSDHMAAAYDDGAGIMAAFNRNVLTRINRELGGRFDCRQFQHQVKWNAFLRRLDLQLVATRQMDVYISALGRRFAFENREPIRTEAFYYFSELELETLAKTVGFRFVKSWTDIEYPFAEVLWTV